MREQFLIEAERRVREIFKRFAENKDVAPARQSRDEGFLEAGVFLGLASEEELSSMLLRLQQEVLGVEDQRLPGATLSIPTLVKRAPVYPG